MIIGGSYIEKMQQFIKSYKDSFDYYSSIILLSFTSFRMSLSNPRENMSDFNFDLRSNLISYPKKIIFWKYIDNLRWIYIKSFIRTSKYNNFWSIFVYIFIKWMPPYNYICRVMNKYDDSPIKQSSFFQKFSGKVSKVPRLGINAILLRE